MRLGGSAGHRGGVGEQAPTLTTGGRVLSVKGGVLGLAAGDRTLLRAAFGVTATVGLGAC